MHVYKYNIYTYIFMYTYVNKTHTYIYTNIYTYTYRLGLWGLNHPMIGESSTAAAHHSLRPCDG